MTEPENLASRAHLAPGAKVGVTEEMIHDVVHRFYGEIRTDPALGPIFKRVLGEDWEPHLAKMCDFWSSVLLMTGRFTGNPMQAHLDVGGIRPTHFARWLHVFRQITERVCPPAAAELFVARAEMIARALQRGLAAFSPDLSAPNYSLAKGGAPDKDALFSPEPQRGG